MPALYFECLVLRTAAACKLYFLATCGFGIHCLLSSLLLPSPTTQMSTSLKAATASYSASPSRYSTTTSCTMSPPANIYSVKKEFSRVQNTNPSTAQNAAQSNLDGEDFFTKAQTQPQGASFSLPKAPSWLERPIGASFGFGGKVVIFKQNLSAPGQPRSSKVLAASL